MTDVVSDLAELRFDGDRFAFEPYAESVESDERGGSKLQEIFAEGITVVGSEQLSSIRKRMITDE